LITHPNEPPPHVRSLRPELPEPVAAVLMKALAKSPAERYASAGELARAFRTAFTAPAPAAAAASAATEVATEVQGEPASPVGIECPGCGALIPAGAGICPACMYMIPLDQLPKLGAQGQRKVQRREVVLNLVPYHVRWDAAGLETARQLATAALHQATV